MTINDFENLFMFAGGLGMFQFEHLILTCPV